MIGQDGALPLEALLDDAARAGGALVFRRGVPMARYTTLRLGGPADLFCEPASPEQLRMALVLAHARGVPVTIVGRGSNLLVRDGGIRGLVVRIARAMRRLAVRDNVLTAQAGALLSAAAAEAADRGLAGLAFAGGIPGTVGGGAYMNAGAYGGEMSQVVAGAEGFDFAGNPVRLAREELAFGYRASRLQQGDVVVASVVFSLAPGNRDELWAEMNELHRRRAEKQPLDVPSAGSTFRRPAGCYAAALIEECGLKGRRIGGAQVSEKHAGFLVNQGGTAADFLALMALVQSTVYERRGVALTPEVRILGEDAAPGAV